MVKRIFAAALSLLLVLGLALPAIALEYEDSDRVRSIRISNTSMRMYTGETRQLSITFSPYDTSDDLTWSSSNNGVASVSGDGLVEATGAGDAIIYAKISGGLQASCRIQVLRDGETIAIRDVEISMSTLSVRVGDTRQLMASVLPGGVDEDDKEITWSTKDGKIAEVDAYGTVMGMSEGETNIIATATNGMTAICRVTVISALSSSSTQSATNKTSSSNTAFTAESVKAAVTQLAKSTSKGSSATLPAYKGQTSVTPAILDAAASAAKAADRTIKLRFATLGQGQKTYNYLTLDPQLFTGRKTDLKVGVYTDSAEAVAAGKMLGKYYGNKAAAVSCSNTGSFGAGVTIHAKLDLTGMDTKNLKFYSYDSSTNSVSELKNTSYVVDKNGFVNFTTTVGGVLLVSDGALAKK